MYIIFLRRLNMRNFANYVSYLPKQVAGLMAVLALIVLPLSAVQATDHNEPAFNIYPDAQYTGDESDFLRVDEAGGDAFTNEIEACEGEVDLWVYVHNGQVEEHNGTNYDGPGVAKDTKVKIAIPMAEAGDVFQTRAQISASNADTVNDEAYIRCGSHDIQLDYVEGSARGYTFTRGNFSINDAIVTAEDGTLIGSFTDDGVVPGCWDYRVWIKVTVKIEKVEEPEPIYSCDMLDEIVIDRDTRQFTANATAQNGAKVISYEFDFDNDGTVDQTIETDALEATSQEYTYAPGDYTARVTVNFDTNNDGVADQSQTNANCTDEVTVNEEPETPIYVCNSATAFPDKLFPGQKTTVTVDVVTEGNNVSVKQLSYDWGDDSDNTVTNALTASHSYAKVGTYDIVVTVTFDVDGVEKSVECSDRVTVEETPEVIPPRELPETGPAAIAAGFFGTSALGMSVRSWFESRAMLRAGLLSKKQ
jgi:PKD repeat protein